MAKNTYKTNTSKNKEQTEGQVEEPKKFDLSFFKDQRFKVSIGFLLLFSSVFLTISFLSYLFTGKADQSVVEAFWDTNIAETGAETQNWLGFVGAFCSYYFIFKWFGIAAFLITPVVFVIGAKMVFAKEILPVWRFIQFSTFYVFWFSLLLGYFVLIAEEVSALGFLSGGLGYELAILFYGMIGWGTPLFLVLSFMVFLVYFFNVTNFNWSKPKSEDQDKLDIKASKTPIVPVPVDRNEEIEEEIEDEDEDLEDWTVKNDVAVNKPSPELAIKKEPELSIEVKDPLRKENKIENIDLAIETAEEEEEVNIDEVIPGGEIENYDPTLDLSQYQFPTVDLLNEYAPSKVQVSKEELEANKDKIVETLANYSIGISSIKATIGPTVTLYEIVPEAGVRISKIKSLEDDIALNLAALGIRIIAPIPGKGTIGIEVPNTNKEMVSMRSVLATEKFLKSDKELPVVLGKTISNEVYVFDLAKMPHLLMAGATGQGKSVGLNILLTSLIYKKHPSQLKFVLVDPKKVELSLFNTLERHFLAKLPNSEEAIITDTKKVVNTLNSLCIEMDTRYDLLKEAGCRNLKEYNKKFVERRLNPEKGHKFMPYIVLVIDELADLMMTAGKEVEQPIARLAQLARAIGIHLVVATQRPSVNVITGIIKANFPARLSFKVTSKVDSRTILDTGGAEQLVGQGDMLLSLGSDIIRIQCAFIDTPEVEAICEFIGSQRGYSSAYLLPEYEGDESGEEKEEIDLANRDPLFEEAARLIVMHQQGSTSLIQRRMKLGYNRAGRLIDQLEAAGVVGAFEGSKAREVLIHDEQSLEQLLNGLAKKYN